MDIPEISVIMAVYNDEKYLKKAIDSILNQTFGNFEFIIINDASTDNTEKILLEYEDHRIKILKNELNLGLTKSLNKGLEISRGKYIARMDADDISYLNRFEQQYNILESEPEIGIVCSWTEIIDENDNVIDTWKGDNTPELIYYILNFRNCLTHSSVLLRKELILHYGPYNENIKKAQDYELWNRFSKITKIYKIDKYLIKWRKTGNSITSLYSSAQAETVKKIFINNFKFTILTNDDIGILNFIQNNFELFSNNDIYMDENKILSSIRIYYQINKYIINTTPASLDRNKVKIISNNYYNNYIFNICRILGLKKVLKNLEISNIDKLKLLLIIYIKYIKMNIYIYIIKNLKSI